MGLGLSEMMRVAVVGAGPAGAAFAAALLASGRAFGRRVDVTLFDGQREREVVPPALLDSDTRCRLASLGAAVPVRQNAVEVQGVLVHIAGRSALLEPAPGTLWIVDSPSTPGATQVKQALHVAATARGARLRRAVVDSVELQRDRAVVRAFGSSESFDLVAGAFGTESPLAGRWLDGRFAAPRRATSAHARVSWGGRDDLLRVCFWPTPEVEALMLVPCRTSAYVLAIGENVGGRALAEALAVLTRDRLLPSGLQLRAVERLTLGTGAAGTLARGPAITLGSAAFGNLLDPGLQPALVSAMRSASAVLDVGAHGPLQRRLAHAEVDLAEHAARQPALLRWARRAGGRAPDAFAAVASERAAPPFASLNVLGLAPLTSSRLLSKLRRAALRRLFSEAFVPFAEPEPAPPSAEPLVYVVDDDPDARNLLVDYLNGRGVTVRAFEDELALLEAAARERPKAILLDVVLRWVDGFSLCRALRGHPATARARVISMSSLSRDSDRQAALAAGADAFLPKPIDLDELDRLLAFVWPPGGRSGREVAAEA